MKHLKALAMFVAVGVGVPGLHYAHVRVTAQAAQTAATANAPATATDWPQWRGQNRDGMSRETGLLKTGIERHV